jgi:MFS family permease
MGTNNDIAVVTTKPKRRWLTVFSLSAAAFVDSSENETISILWPFIYPSMGLSIGLLGLILGISDLVRTLTLPFWGYAADHFSRKTLLVVVTGFWGIWTMAIAVVQTLPQLMVVRVISSLGLGVLWPTAFSLLSDLFERKERGRAAGIMTAVSFSGTIVSFGVLPLLAAGDPEAWRLGFVVMGLASVVTGLLLLLVNDPPRGSAEPELDDIITEEAASRYAFKISDLPEISRVRSWWVLVFHQSIDWIALAVLYGWSFTWLSTLGLGESAFMVVALLTLGTLIGHAFFGWLGDVLEGRYPDHGRSAMAQIGLLVSIPALTGFILMGSQGIVGLMIFGLLAGLSLSSVDTGARWPIAQAVLRPEIRATGRAALDMAVGVVSALAVAFSGLLVNQFDGNVTLMLLLLVPIPKLISSILWIPMFRTYPPDRDALHDVLVQRREEILSAGDQDADQ